MIATAYRIVAAVSEHVVAQQALAGGDEGIGVDKSADGGVVITALQVIEPGILGGTLAKMTFLSLTGIAYGYPRSVSAALR